jgi:hypothetical protein
MTSISAQSRLEETSGVPTSLLLSKTLAGSLLQSQRHSLVNPLDASISSTAVLSFNSFEK